MTGMNSAAYQTYDHDSVHLDPQDPFFLAHVARYWWVLERIAGKKVADCATGKGYGAYIMAQKAQSVLGFDLNEDSLRQAREIFGNHAPNLKYEKRNVLEFKNSNEKFDVVSAFEIIEHIPPETTDDFLNGLAHALDPQNGVLYLSTPNHDVVVKSGVHVPEFHINNFKSVELKKKLEEFFEDVTMLGQYQKRGPLYQFIFALDFFNWRHLLPKTRPLKLNPDLNPENDSALLSPEQVREVYEKPPQEYASTCFSPLHWRQAGMTMAICRHPKFLG